jgi:hypothetical protein
MGSSFPQGSGDGTGCFRCYHVLVFPLVPAYLNL